MTTQGRSADSSFLFRKCLSICTLLWTATLVMRMLRKSAPLDRVYISEKNEASVAVFSVIIRKPKLLQKLCRLIATYTIGKHSVLID